MDALIDAARRSPRLRVAVTSSALSLALLGPGVAVGHARTADPTDRRDRVQSQIVAARDDLTELSVEAATSVERLAATRAELTRAQSRLAAATAALGLALQRTAGLETRLRAAQARETAGAAALARNAGQTKVAEQRRDTLARLAYESGGSGDLVALVDIDSARDFAERAYLVQEVGAHQGGVIDDLQEFRRARLLEQASLATARREVAQLTLQARAAQDQAAYARSRQASSTTELSALAATQAGQQRDVESRRAAERTRVARLEAESARLTRLLRARATAARAMPATPRSARSGPGNTGRGHVVNRTSAPSRGSGATLSYPVRAQITSGFGMRFHPILNYARLHAGVDFGAPCGAPVHAAADGDIVRAGWAGGFGNQVVIAHDGPFATSYNHLSRIASPGRHVRRGQLIGYVGTTGLSTGCHLHFETRVNGSVVNPMGYL